MEGFKYKAVMPSFNISTPSLQDMVTFGKAIQNERVQTYYYLGIVSAIRPEHMLRLTKGLFDAQNNMINTWMKTFGKKNFFFSFYTNDSKAYIEKYLATITDNNLIFPIGKRYIQKQFEKARKTTNIKITPKIMRKFTTNWLRRHGMIEEDVNVLTGHTPQSIIAKHYMDVSRIHEEYDRAMTDIKLNL
jgi:intergrase/recombinase